MLGVSSQKKQIDACHPLSKQYGSPALKQKCEKLIKLRQVQDLERQLFQTRQQVEQLKAMIPKQDLSSVLKMSSPGQSRLDIPSVGLSQQRRPKPPIVQDLSRVRSNLRFYGRGLLKVPTPYRRLSSQHGLPAELPRLPPKATADRLLSQYFNHVHLQFPLIHQPTFHAEYEKVYKDGNLVAMRRGWIAILFAVFACGSLHALDPNRLQNGKEYLTKGTSMVDFWSDELTVDQAKMSFLVSVFCMEINLKSASWVWLGSAARVAQDIGLHVETGPWPTIEGEIWRRVWYCIYTFDRFVRPFRFMTSSDRMSQTTCT